jgi:cytidine deaminase
MQGVLNTYIGQVSFDLLVHRARDICNPRMLSESASCGSVGAALESAQGDVYVGICVDTSSSLGFCAEHAAAAAMLAAGQHVVRRMVAVRADTGSVLSPCGRCRELIAQLAPENLSTRVMVDDRTEVSLHDLLPHR